MTTIKTFGTALLSAAILMGCGQQQDQANSSAKPTAQETAKLSYPVTKQGDVVDEYFGTKVSDPYRWLEDDMSAETASWVKQQNDVTQGYLKQIPYREEIESRLANIMDYEKVSQPFVEGDYTYFYKNDGLQNQSVLYSQASLDAEGEVFLDPNTLSNDGTVSMAGFAVSEDGKYAAYQIQRSGSDWREIHVMEVASKKKLEDVVYWVKFSGISWYKDGFYYSRYDEPKDGDALKGANQYQKVYYHKVGTEQSEDQLVYQDQEHAQRGFSAGTTEDERFLILSGWESTSGNTLMIKDLEKSNSDFVTIIDNFENDHNIVGSDGDDLYIITTLDAPNQRLVKVSAANPSPANWKDVLPQTKNVLRSVSLVGGKIIANYMVDARSQIEQYDLSGKLEREIKLPTIGSAGGFGGKKEDKEVFYTFTSFTFPPTIYRYNIETGESTLFRQPKVDFNPDDYETKQIKYKSKDGTEVPMFITHKKGLKMDGTNPTYLYSYGGFNVSLNPGFAVTRLLFMEMGGVFAMPNIRGGGEYGETWHEAGTKMQKQNVFDDFIAAAEYLHKEKYTSPAYTAIAGGSNGGLLVGATLTQRPDICKVALPAVGVLDMLRYQYFTIGRAWSSDYGTSEDSKEMFEYLYKYSPLHNTKKGTSYPATMVTTADHDDRVVPAHSFKFISALQAANKGDNPVLIRIEEKAGHGAGVPTSKRIQATVDIYAFVFQNMGINPLAGK